jgi:hypothetical protein
MPGMCGHGLVLGLLLTNELVGDAPVLAARRRLAGKKTRAAPQEVAGVRDQRHCAAGARGWQVPPASRFEAPARACQFDRLSMHEASAVFVQQYEGIKPFIVTDATANLPDAAFSRCAMHHEACVLQPSPSPLHIVAEAAVFPAMYQYALLEPACVPNQIPVG